MSKTPSTDLGKGLILKRHGLRVLRIGGLDEASIVTI